MFRNNDTQGAASDIGKLVFATSPCQDTNLRIFMKQTNEEPERTEFMFENSLAFQALLDVVNNANAAANIGKLVLATNYQVIHHVNDQIVDPVNTREAKPIIAEELQKDPPSSFAILLDTFIPTRFPRDVFYEGSGQVKPEIIKLEPEEYQAALHKPVRPSFQRRIINDCKSESLTFSEIELAKYGAGNKRNTDIVDSDEMHKWHLVEKEWTVRIMEGRRFIHNTRPINL